ncbi:hypothetical protein D1007_02813 [Hordeum vulgare]|nr:hypothetical protein D1007_02813 [Hordeum vulgare]
MSHDPGSFPDLGKPDVLWVIAPFPTACFSAAGVTGLPFYFFCAPDESLKVVRVGELVFCVEVASPAIAAFLIVLALASCLPLTCPSLRRVAGPAWQRPCLWLE